MDKKLVLKIGVTVVPIVMAVLTAMYGDITPVVRDFCETMLPSGTMVHEVDAGAAR